MREDPFAASISPEAGGHSRPVSLFRAINLGNPVLQQVLERKNEVLCVLIQKIVTTQQCVIWEHVQVEEQCGGVVGIQTKVVQVRGCPGVEAPGLEVLVIAARVRGLLGLCLCLSGLFCSELIETQLKLA